MSLAASRPLVTTERWEDLQGGIEVGVDLIQLLGSGMYVEPLDLYREYIQNATDSIDIARERGVVAGRIDIQIDPVGRCVNIRDDGFGLPKRSFLHSLMAVGASAKRQERRRGLRGIGRLAALGYCQELRFRSTARGETVVSELRWDCRVLRSQLRQAKRNDLAEILEAAVQYRSVPSSEDDHYFEVFLDGIVRLGGDEILNEELVSAYLSEVAPVRFSDDFRFAGRIRSVLESAEQSSDYAIYINGCGPLKRPHSDTIEMKASQSSRMLEIEVIQIPAVDGSIAAYAWLLHHEYLGAIPSSARVRGLRLRVGNLQIGDDAVLATKFTEPRFNSWSIGEIHVVDPRINPNGRRDFFEHSVHLDNLVNHLALVARRISQKCRSASEGRLATRRVAQVEERVQKLLRIMEARVLNSELSAQLVQDTREEIAKLRKITARVTIDEGQLLTPRCDGYEHRLNSWKQSQSMKATDSSLPAAKRRAYEEIFGHIYACSRDRYRAHELIAKVIERVEAVGRSTERASGETSGRSPVRIGSRRRRQDS